MNYIKCHLRRNFQIHLAFHLFDNFVCCLALFIAPSFFPASVVAANPNSAWELVGEFNSQSYYLNHATSRRSDSRVQIWNLTQLKEPAYTTRGRAYISKKTLLEINCQQKTLLVAEDTWYPKPWAEGSPVFESGTLNTKPILVQSQSPSEAILKAACGRR